MTSVDNPAAFAGLVGIGTDGNIGMLVGDQWADLGMLGGQPVSALSWDHTNGCLWAVGMDGTYASWDPGSRTWDEQLNGGGAYLPEEKDGDGTVVTQGFDNRIRQYYQDPQGTFWRVHWNGDVDSYTPDFQITHSGLLGNWTVKMVAVNPSAEVWGVGTGGNVGQLMDDNTWHDYTSLYGNWSFNVFTFDPNGTPWGIGTEGNVGRRDPVTGNWVDDGLVGGWTMANLYWPPKSTTFPPE
jgi:hypothetical protein